MPLWHELAETNSDSLSILLLLISFCGVQQKNRLEQKGLLKRFSIKCYGKQETLESMREEKALKYKELKNKRGTKEYDSWFLRYIPFEEEMNITSTVI